MATSQLRFSTSGQDRWLLSSMVAVGLTSALVPTLRCIAKRRAERLRAAGIVSECDVMSVVGGEWPLLHFLAHRNFHSLVRLAARVAPAHAIDVCATGGQWTALHIAATQGHADVVLSLIAARATIDVADAGGNTSLAIAAARGHSTIAGALLGARAAPDVVNAKGSTALHFAAARGHPAVMGLMLEAGVEAEITDSKGWTPLLVACSQETSWPAAMRLLEACSNADASTFGEGLSALMLVSKWTSGPTEEAVDALLSYRADPTSVDSFGQSALHLACRSGSPKTIAALCAGGALPSAQDNDGTYPLFLLLARCAQMPDDAELVQVAMAALLRADPQVAQLLDFGDAQALLHLCLYASLERSSPVIAAKLLLESHADPSAEDESGWTAAHWSANTVSANLVLLEMFRASTIVPASFWESFDPKKVRNTSNRKYHARRGGHHRIPLEERTAVLGGELSLAAVARRLAERRSTKIVALTGAGISTSAGVPDFRSAGGLWTQPATRALFSAEGFVNEPEVFWRQSAALFGKRQPTRAHALLARLAREGLLRRVYTQNIDGLEAAAGIPEELIVECHGNASRVICSADPSHEVGTASSDVTDLAVCSGDAWRAPRCPTCGALLRPDIVFFGEPLPSAFARHSGEDVRACDLLLVFGTSLSVYPVAGLVQRVGALTPRLLVNQEAAGVWRSPPEHNYRDVFWGGECDAGAEAMAEQLGWQLTPQ